MTYRFIYKITCTKGIWKNHFYVGKHTTDNINDGYKGSGAKINEYYKKYPDDYIKEIICYCNDEDELLDKEISTIKKYIHHPLCLNLVESNIGGKQPKRLMKKAIETRRKHTINNEWHSSETIKKLSQINKGAKWMNNGIENHFVLKDKINFFIENGYHFGKIKRG